MCSIKPHNEKLDIILFSLYYLLFPLYHFCWLYGVRTFLKGFVYTAKTNRCLLQL